MSSLTSKPSMRSLEPDELPEGWKRGYMLTRGFSYDLGKKGSGDNIRVPKGFVTNHASIPRILWFVFAADDSRWVKASILHDYLYQTQYPSKEVADAIFFESCMVGGTPRDRDWETNTNHSIRGIEA